MAQPCTCSASRSAAFGIARCAGAANAVEFAGTGCASCWLVGCLLLAYAIHTLCVALASSPEAGAGCGNPARPDLWRGCWATGIPTPNYGCNRKDFCPVTHHGVTRSTLNVRPQGQLFWTHLHIATRTRAYAGGGTRSSLILRKLRLPAAVRTVLRKYSKARSPRRSKKACGIMIS